jgi:peptide/nickel transport system permease protein
LRGPAVITESVFAWPGMGKLVVDAIFFRDFPVVQTVLIFSATIFVLINRNSSRFPVWRVTP